MENLKIAIYYISQTASLSGFTDTNRLVPAPLISINPEIYYVNDSIIGYTYNINLNGYANALRLNDRPNNAPSYGIDHVISHMDHIRNIFNFNGGNLYVRSLANNKDILVAKGATIKNISFDQSNNYWINYAPYSIQIEFNEVDFIGCSEETDDIISCDKSFFHLLPSGTPNSKNLPSDNLVDFTKYKLKQFSDKWNFTLDEEVYNELPTNINHNFKITYEVSAVGKNYYLNGKFIPSWEMAKMFCQDRLYRQIKTLLDTTLPIKANSYAAGNAIDAPNELFNTDNPDMTTHSSILDNLQDEFRVYNEVINCDTSESDGLFSLSYNAIVKKYDSDQSPSENSAIHDYTMSVNHTDDDAAQVSISVNGSVKGLMEGGFIYEAVKDDFELPQNGSFIMKKENALTKYNSAYDSFIANIKHPTNDDLSDSLKNTLGITNSGLLITDTNGEAIPGNPRATSFIIDHNYHNGNIDYIATFDSVNSRSIELGYTNVSITRTYPTDNIQEFVIPGRANGPIIQKLGSKEYGRISINIDGASPRNIATNANFSPCNSLPDLTDIAGLSALTEITSHPDYIKTREQYNVNQIDGSFNVSLEFLCRKV